MLVKGLHPSRLAPVVSCLAAVLLAGVVSCDLTNDTADEVVVAGTVQRVQVGGSCWCVVTGTGKHYELTNLADDYKISGLAVRARLRLRRDMASTCMVGEIADVLEVERVPVR